MFDRQEMEAERIHNTATNARNTSRTAYDLAREALRKPEDTADDIEDLKREWVCYDIQEAFTGNANWRKSEFWSLVWHHFHSYDTWKCILKQ